MIALSGVNDTFLQTMSPSRCDSTQCLRLPLVECYVKRLILTPIETQVTSRSCVPWWNDVIKRVIISEKMSLAGRSREGG